jgi:hypothetical protein
MFRCSITLLACTLGLSASAATGGPDANGYTFYDSNEPDGPDFEFEDISGSGTGLNLTDDSGAQVNLGFSFPFGDATYTALYATSNGTLLFNSNNTSYTNACPMPGTGMGQHALMVYWDDLNPATSGDVYWRSFPSANPPYLIVQWHQIPQYGQTNTHTFQAKLFATGLIEYHYQRVDSSGSAASIGIQSDNGDALQYSCDQASLTSGRAIRFARCEAGLDFDGDGFDDCADCDDLKPYVYPGAADGCDSIDNDCDGVDGPDFDGDGWSTCARDCNDQNAAIFPTAREVACDGIDQDCDPWTLDNPDVDGDGFFACTTDCDDASADISPLQTEILCNGHDDDCDPSTPDDDDLDGDGYTRCIDDCDDTNIAISPIAIEVTCNGVDEDCDEVNTPDSTDDDGDANSVCDGDCDDNNAAINTLRAERPCNGVDDDCNELTADLADVDGDGVSVCDDDCDDRNAGIAPNAEEVLCNFLDDDCDDRTEDDADEDRDGVTTCRDDCDDANPFAAPNQVERCDDGVDNDCDGRSDEGCVTEDTDTVVDDPTACSGCAQGSAGAGFGGLWLAVIALLRRRR